MTTFHITSLGCPKNLVDSERLGRALTRQGLSRAPSEEAARVVVVNTCGFIRAACEESLEAVLGLAARKGDGSLRLLVVAGCLSGRYGAELERELPEVDLFFGPLTDEVSAEGAAAGIARAVGLTGGAAAACPAPEGWRLTPPWRAYVKIAEGCSNRCTYCTIPAIRGRRRSRPPGEIASEVAALAQAGVREVTLVAQETSAWGADLRPRAALSELLERLAGETTGPDWLRLLYLHPERVDGRLIEVMSGGGRLLPYFDIPVQHASPAILRRMGRRGGAAEFLRLIEAIRSRCPRAVLRTSIIVGFPGEGEREFRELKEFVREARFDHLGCFLYSAEEGTPAAQLRPRVTGRVAERRLAELMALQAEVSQAANEALIGRSLGVLLEEVREGRLIGRAARHAPEIDGEVAALPAPGLAPGRIVPVVITGASAYDLEGRLAPR